MNAEQIAQELAQLKAKVDGVLLEQVEEVKRDVATVRTKITEVQSQLIENTAVTHQVRDILGSFRVMASLAKWVTVVGGAAIFLWHQVTGTAPK